MSFIVYMCINKINGKKYIGYTSKSIEERIRGHYKKAQKSKYKKDVFYFQHALNKYNVEDFEWSILNTLDSIEEAYRCEIDMIQCHKSLHPFGYNLTLGGPGLRSCGVVARNISNKLRQNRIENGPQKMNFSKEFIQKLKERTNDFNEKVKSGILTHPLKGFKHSEKSKNEMSSTKRNNNKKTWYNFLTKEIIVCSIVEINEHVKSKSDRFNHLVGMRRAILDDGWIYVGEEDSAFLDMGVLFDSCPRSNIKKQLSL